MQNSQDNPWIVRYRLYLLKISKNPTKNKPLFSYLSNNNIWDLRKNSFQAFIFESFFSWLEKIFEQRYQSSQLWERFLEFSVLIVGEFLRVCHLVAHQFCRGQRGLLWGGSVLGVYYTRDHSRHQCQAFEQRSLWEHVKLNFVLCRDHSQNPPRPRWSILILKTKFKKSSLILTPTLSALEMSNYKTITCIKNG